MNRVITLTEPGEITIQDRKGRTLVRVLTERSTLGSKGSLYTTVTSPPYMERDDEGFTKSGHYFFDQGEGG